MPRRGENIYKRRDGRWEGRIRSEACLRNGKKYRSVYGKTYGEVKRKVEEAKRESYLMKGQCTMSMREAVNIWYADKKGAWKESTYAAYRQMTEKYILPYLGEMPLYKINGFVMGEFIIEIQAENQKRKRKLSNIYLSDICGTVQRIMSHIQKKTGAVLEIPVNPVEAEKKAKIMPPQDMELSALEAYLLQNIENDTCLGILTALHTGLRIGELCALTWQDIDLKTGVLHIRNTIQRVKDYEGQENKTKLLFLTPKTIHSVRDIPIPPVLFPVLRSCQKAGTEPFVKSPKGEWMEPRTLQYRFKKILEACGIPYFRFHMLRHAFATRCIEKGFDSKSLSEILGHSSIQITLNLYVHSTLQQKRHLMNLIESYSDEGIL